MDHAKDLHVVLPDHPVDHEGGRAGNDNVTVEPVIPTLAIYNDYISDFVGKSSNLGNDSH